MRTILFCLIFLQLLSCGNDTTEEPSIKEENTAIPKYDTLPLDSFSQGATSVDVARKIRISSQIYQDSLRMIQQKLKEEQLLKKETEDKAKAEKTLEESKKKAEAEKLKKEKAPIIPEVPAP